MIIGVDGSRYRENDATGVEWYSYFIIKELMRLTAERAHELKLKIYVGDEDSAHWNLMPGVEVKVVEAKRLWTLRALSKEIKHSPIDVLFIPSHVLPLFRPKKSVITIHDVAFCHFKEVYGFFQRLYLNWSTRYAVKHANVLIVPSKATKDDLVKFFQAAPGKIVVIKHGFKEPKPKPDMRLFAESDAFSYFGLSPESKYLLFVGRLESKKNLERVVEAFKLFSEKHPDYKLVLAGKRGVGAEAIIRKVNKLKLADKVVMPGYVSEEEKATLYEYCQGVVFVSLYEGFGLPVLESFHYRKPILVSNSSSLSEVAGDAGIVVDPMSVKEIAEGMCDLIEDSALVGNLVARGAKRLEDYSWKDSGRETMKVLTDDL
ncbi:hypothetical protein CVV38_02245 [Candidatus Peregrinibacteria bacterium HGW-Peregrinibacteria-1]|jgi:glycosyltransferase involved in cell wall biosynthesis|nr:MAG: hypothetical protein CVV38_02245 [Candidatus Peregrinibacteria bacterium HGW-Peregrinibacteria-1]